jgi:hypothetical protein
MIYNLIYNVNRTFYKSCTLNFPQIVFIYTINENLGLHIISRKHTDQR